jgi:hypothetical protein
MLGKAEKSFKPFQRLWRQATDRLMETVPEDVAVCGFDCRSGSCTIRQWKTWERRIQKAAA